MATAQDVVNYANTLVGKKVTVPTNPYGGQCVALIDHIVQHFTDGKKNMAYINAADGLRKAKDMELTVVQNNPNDPYLLPQAGDFFVMNDPHPWGHIGVVVSADVSGMHTIEQNIDGYRDDNGNGINDQLEVGGGGYTRKNYRDYSYVVGWFRLPYSGSQKPQKQKEGKSTMEPKNVNGDLYSGLITEARPEVFWSGGKRSGKIQYIVIHGTATTSVTGAYSTWLRSRNNQTSAHYLVTPNATMGCVGENYVAWHSGGTGAITNENSIGIEHINSSIGDVNDPNTYLFDDATLDRGAKLVAEICLRYGLKPDSSVIVPHRQASATACPQTLDMTDYIKRVQRYYSEMKGGTVSKEETVQKPAISKKETTGSFKVRVSVTDLNIRKESSLKAKTNGKVKPGVYTITETKTADGYEWGKLKSGAGWIALKYTKRL